MPSFDRNSNHEDTKTRQRINTLLRDFVVSRLQLKPVFLVATCALLVALDAPAAQSGKRRAAAARPLPSSVATITSITRAALPDVVRVTIELDEEVPRFHEERIPDPDRVFLDLPSTRAAASLVDRTLRFERDNDVVRQVRVGRHPNTTTRVVLDAAGVSSYSVFALYNPYRLVVECARVSTVRTADSRLSTTDYRLPSLLLPSVWGRSLPSRRARQTALLDAAREATSTDLVAAVPRAVAPLNSLEMPAGPPPKLASGRFSIARQLGLNVSRIVIDPGHGGHDPGAQGRGITEAELVLDVALRLEALLQKTAGVEVMLTRRTDDFVPLPERTAIANREGADLFLSIHANASARASARGVETYFLNFADNLSAAAVAARENAASGQAMGALPDFVKAIALNNKVDESRELATYVQRAMLDRLRGSNRALKDLGVKQAPFVVLIGAAMPSVLAEISFITNPQEAKLLRSSAYRQRIADALLHAIRKYQTSLRNVTAVAHQ
jgi:N-acetylmuramoyl-L-alanine amidase